MYILEIFLVRFMNLGPRDGELADFSFRVSIHFLIKVFESGTSRLQTRFFPSNDHFYLSLIKLRKLKVSYPPYVDSA